MLLGSSVITDKLGLKKNVHGTAKNLDRRVKYY